VLDDGSVVTPELTGTILEGVTRDSILTILDSTGHKVDERRISVDEWREGATSGRIREVFACGTAAVVTPVGRLVEPGRETVVGGGETGPVTSSVRAALLDLQYGRTPDSRGWLHRLV
jgi:branched-chain amino acid aminotransferase